MLPILWHLTCIWDFFNVTTDARTLQSNCLTIQKASQLNQVRQVEQLDDAGTLAANPNYWQIWKCLKWIPAQNRCNTPQLKEKKKNKTPVAKHYMTKSDYTRKSKGMKF